MKTLAWKQIIITFAISFVIGTFFGRWEYFKETKHQWKSPEAKQAWILKRLDSKLKLDQGQKEKIALILKESAPKMAAARAQARSKIEEIKEQVKQQILPLLTPEQKIKYEEMEFERRERKRLKVNA